MLWTPCLVPVIIFGGRTLLEWFPFKARVGNLLASACKCADGNCWNQFRCDEVLEFLNQFEARTKLEQDSILYLAADPHCMGRSRKEYIFLQRPMRRTCFETLLGVSSHRIDKLGAIDLRYGKRAPKPTPLMASVDSFCMILYNSIAEPLPNKRLFQSHTRFFVWNLQSTLYKETFLFFQKVLIFAVK